MSKILEKLRKREITLLIIRSIALFIMSIIGLIVAFIIRSDDDNKISVLLIACSIFIFIIMIFNILYEYFKFLKKD